MRMSLAVVGFLKCVSLRIIQRCANYACHFVSHRTSSFRYRVIVLRNLAVPFIYIIHHAKNHIIVTIIILYNFQDGLS